MAARDSTLWKWTGKRFKYIGPTALSRRGTTVYASPRMVVQFELDRAGMRKIMVGRELAAATHSAVVGRAMPFAIQISPRDTLEYVSSWRASDTHMVIAGMRRVATKLVNVAPHAAAVEWGRGGRQAVLKRTLAHLNSTSPIGLEKAARSARARKAYNPDLHPRGAGGRFLPKQRTIRDVVSQEVKHRTRRGH